jgi:hypothetical protein
MTKKTDNTMIKKTDNTLTKRKREKRPTMVDKTLHIKLNNRQHKSHQKTVGELMCSGRV